MATRENPKARVYLKKELGGIPMDTLIWVENKDALDGWELDVECFQGVNDHRYGAHGEYYTCVDYMRGYDEVAEYGIEYRFWTDRPTQEQMEETPWQSQS